MNFKQGTVFTDTRFNKEYTIKEVTDKRVIIWEDGTDYTTTGRKVSTWWVSIKTFTDHLDKGNYSVVKE